MRREQAKAPSPPRPRAGSKAKAQAKNIEARPLFARGTPAPFPVVSPQRNQRGETPAESAARLDAETEEMALEDKAKTEAGECICVDDMEHNTTDGEFFVLEADSHAWAHADADVRCALHHDPRRCVVCAWRNRKADPERLAYLETVHLAIFELGESLEDVVSLARAGQLEAHERGQVIAKLDNLRDAVCEARR